MRGSSSWSRLLDKSTILTWALTVCDRARFPDDLDVCWEARGRSSASFLSSSLPDGMSYGSGFPGVVGLVGTVEAFLACTDGCDEGTGFFLRNEPAGVASTFPVGFEDGVDFCELVCRCDTTLCTSEGIFIRGLNCLTAGRLAG